MKKHFWGTLIFLVAFFIGFLASPVRFTNDIISCGVRSTFTTYQSTYLERVVSEHTEYEEQKELDRDFDEQVKLYSEYVKNQQILELKENRAVITFQTNDLGQRFCVIRKGNKELLGICSASLWHVLEFEKQKFREK
jgi:hypothetical protein